MVRTCLTRAQRVITEVLGYMTGTCARREIPRTRTNIWKQAKKRMNFELC